MAAVMLCILLTKRADDEVGVPTGTFRGRLQLREGTE